MARHLTYFIAFIVVITVLTTDALPTALKSRRFSDYHESFLNDAAVANFKNKNEDQIRDQVSDIFVIVLGRLPVGKEADAFVRAMYLGNMSTVDVSDFLQRSEEHQKSQGQYVTGVLVPPFVPFHKTDNEARKRVREYPDYYKMRQIVRDYAELLGRLPTEDEVAKHYHTDPYDTTAIRKTDEYKLVSRSEYTDDTQGRVAPMDGRREARRINADRDIARVYSYVHGVDTKPPLFLMHVFRAMFEDTGYDVRVMERRLRRIKRQREDLQSYGALTPSALPRDQTNDVVSGAAPFVPAIRDENLIYGVNEGRDDQKTWGQFVMEREYETLQ